MDAQEVREAQRAQEEEAEQQLDEELKARDRRFRLLPLRVCAATAEQQQGKGVAGLLSVVNPLSSGASGGDREAPSRGDREVPMPRMQLYEVLRSTARHKIFGPKYVDAAAYRTTMGCLKPFPEGAQVRHLPLKIWCMHWAAVEWALNLALWLCSGLPFGVDLSKTIKRWVPDFVAYPDEGSRSLIQELYLDLGRFFWAVSFGVVPPMVEAISALATADDWVELDIKQSACAPLASSPLAASDFSVAPCPLLAVQLAEVAETEGATPGWAVNGDTGGINDLVYDSDASFISYLGIYYVAIVAIAAWGLFRAESAEKHMVAAATCGIGGILVPMESATAKMAWPEWWRFQLEKIRTAWRLRCAPWNVPTPLEVEGKDKGIVANAAAYLAKQAVIISILYTFLMLLFMTTTRHHLLYDSSATTVGNRVPDQVLSSADGTFTTSYFFDPVTFDGLEREVSASSNLQSQTGRDAYQALLLVYERENYDSALQVLFLGTLFTISAYQLYSAQKGVYSFVDPDTLLDSYEHPCYQGLTDLVDKRVTEVQAQMFLIRRYARAIAHAAEAGHRPCDYVMSAEFARFHFKISTTIPLVITSDELLVVADKLLEGEWRGPGSGPVDAPNDFAPVALGAAVKAVTAFQLSP